MKKGNQHKHYCGTSGFTLIELVTVIVLVGIIGAMGSEIILQAFRGVKLSTDLSVLYEEGKLAMTRMEKELHHAIPNGLYVNGVGDSISFGKIDAVTQQAVFGRYQETMPTTVITDLNPASTPANGSFLSIYNTAWTTFNSGSAIFEINGVAGNSMTLDGAIPAAGYSPQQRYFICANSAVMFTVTAGGTLNRQTVDIASAGFSILDFASPQPLAMNITPTQDTAGNPIAYFQYQAGTTSRNAVVVINFTLSNLDGSISLPFTKEVQVRNVP